MKPPASKPPASESPAPQPSAPKPRASVPLWKQMFDAVEQAAAPVMADATASSGFAEIMKVGTKISRDMSNQSEALTRRWLHALNLPAAGDVSYLKAQVGSLEAEIRSLRRLIENQANPAAPKKATPKKAAAKRAVPKKPAAKRPAAKKAAAKRTVAS